MSDEKKIEQIPAIRVTPELWAKIKAEADARFERVGEIARERIERSYEAEDPNAPPPIKSAAQEMKETKERLTVEKMERDAARERKEMLTVEGAVQVVEVEYGRTRQELLSLPQAAQLDLGLDDDQTTKLRKLVEDRMTNLIGASREALEELANAGG